jgi:hypothetical protein
MAKAKAICVAVFILVIVSLGWGQETAHTPSTPANGAGASQGTSIEPSRPASDFRPVSGAQPSSLGLGGKKELDISLFATQSWDSNAPGFGTASGNTWEPATSFGGSLQLALDRQNSQTSLTYSGNGIAYPDRTPVWSAYQNLGFSHSLKIGRWGLTVADVFSIAPNSPFGGYGYGLPAGSATSSNPVLDPQYVPNQSVLTGYATNYFNSVMGQFEYGISRRSSWTGSVSYGNLRFTNSSFQNINQITASTGYNYSLTARDSISATYAYSTFSYTNIDSQYRSNTAQFGYSHRLSGRLFIQLAGGPQFINTSGLGFAQTRVQGSGSASLLYSKTRTNLALSYFRGTTGGSGVLTGANTQSAQINVSREVSKAWTSSISIGYANNGGLVQQQTFNTLYVAPSVRRAITRNLGVNFNYSYQRQLTGATCVTLVCGDVGRSFLSFGVDYKFRPIRLE